MSSPWPTAFSMIGASGATGATGATGPQGESFTWKGAYNSLTIYNLNDVVQKTPGNLEICTGVVKAVSTLPFTGSSVNTDGSGLAGTINSPGALCVDSSGNIYVACNTTIRKINPVTNTIVTVVGQTNSNTHQDGNGTAATFQNDISSLEYNGSNIIYIGYTETSSDNGYIRTYNITTGQVTTILTGYSVTNVSLDGSGNLYVTCWIRAGANLIHKFPLSSLETNNGILTNRTTYGQGQLGGGGYYGSKILFDSSGNMYYTSFSELIKFNLSTQQYTLLTSSQGGSFNMILDSTQSFILYPDGPCIRKITFDGTITTYAGIPGTYGYADGTSSTAQFSYIIFICNGPNGILYVSDQGNNYIRRVYLLGTFSSFLYPDATQILNGATDPEGLTGHNGDYFINKSSGIMSQYTTPSFEANAVSGLQLWFDAKDPLGTGIAQESGTVISTWYDKSTNKLNAVGYNSPTINSENQISFNGSSQYFRTEFTGTHTNETGFVVFNFSGASGENGIYSGSTGGIQFHIYDGHLVIASLGVTGNILDNSISVPSSTTVIFEYTLTPTEIIIYKNGNLQGTFFSQTMGAETYRNIGVNGYLSVNTYFNGSMGEILVYNSVLSESNRQKIEGYLAWKWALQGSLPSNHLYASRGPQAPYWNPIVPFVTKVNNGISLGNQYSLGTMVSFSDPTIVNTFTTDATTSLVYVKLWGAGGNGFIGFSGGNGAFISGLLQVKPSTSYTIKIGYGGGQSGSTNTYTAGGGTSILLDNVQLVLAGGGGSSYHGDRRGKASPGRAWTGVPYGDGIVAEGGYSIVNNLEQFYGVNGGDDGWNSDPDWNSQGGQASIGYSPAQNGLVVIYPVVDSTIKRTSNIIGNLNVLGNIVYSTQTPGSWTSPAPTNMAVAIDRLATAVAGLLSGTIP